MGKERNKKIIWVNGCFDVLHVGHIRLLEYAKSKGDKLVVGIDSDRRVKILKGPGRPINNQDERAETLKAIRWVDEVVIFDDEKEMVDKMKACEASKIVIGDDYTGKRVVGQDFLEVEFFKKIAGYSSTHIIEETFQINEDRIF